MRKPALKHFLLSFLLAFASYLLVAVLPVNAQSSNPYTAPVNNSDVPQNLHTYSQNMMIEVMSAMICQLSGVDPIQPSHQCLGIDPFNQKIGYVQGAQGGVAGGAIGSMSNLIASTFQLPISSGQYLNYLASNFGIVKNTYGIETNESVTTTTRSPGSPVAPGINSNGQTGVSPAAFTTGTGFDKLQPVLKVWVALRDLVYVLFVIGFIAVGVAIMLRIKIDPRTVMTIQNRIPRIIAALVLVTFSYAIAGFLIDFMWATIYLILNLFASADPIKSQEIYVNGVKTSVSSLQILYNNVQNGSLTSDNVLTYASRTVGIWNTSWDASRGVGSVVNSMLDNDAGHTITFLFGTIFASVTGGMFGKGISALSKAVSFIPTVGAIASVIGAIGGAVAGAALSDKIVNSVTSIIGFLVILIAVLSALFRLWFKLLIAFVLFMLGIILAPLWIFAGILPGNKLGFGSWIRHMLSQIIIFPITIGMFALGKVVIDGYQSAVDSGSSTFVPPLLGYGADQASIASLIALGLVLITPNVAKWAGDIFKGPKLDATPIGQAFKAGSGTLTGGIKPIAAAQTKTPEMGKKPGFSGALRQIFKY